MIIRDQVELLKKSIALTQAMPGITILFIFSGLAATYFLSLAETRFQESLGYRVFLTLVLCGVLKYLDAGCYSVLSSGFEPPSKRLRFFIAANKYFLPLLWIGFYIFLIYFVFAICFFYLFNAVTANRLSASQTILMLGSNVVALITLYVVPSLYTQGYRGIKAFRHGFLFLRNNLSRSTALLMIIGVKIVLWVPFIFIPSNSPWSVLNTFFAFVYEFISVYLGLIIFLTGVQLLKAEKF